MRCPTPGQSPYPLRIGNGVTGRRDGHFFGGDMNEDDKIIKTRKTLLDIIVKDDKIIKDRSEKIKTLDLFKKIWSSQDHSTLRQKTFKLLGKSTLRIAK